MIYSTSQLYNMALIPVTLSYIYYIGNHETRDVNGWEDHYAEKSFLCQCKDRFGKQIG